MEHREIDSIRRHLKLIEFENSEKSVLILGFSEDVLKEPNLIFVQYRYYIATVYQYLYGHEGLNEFRNQIKIDYGKVRHKIIQYRLGKKYWRRLINRMEYPFFIDNLNGLEKDELYWCQKHKIINKDTFISKY